MKMKMKKSIFLLHSFLSVILVYHTYKQAALLYSPMYSTAVPICRRSRIKKSIHQSIGRLEQTLGMQTMPGIAPR